MEMEQDDLKKTTTLPEVPAPSPVEPPVDSPAPRPPSLLGAHVVGGKVYRFEHERVPVDDFEEVHECFSIALPVDDFEEVHECFSIALPVDDFEEVHECFSIALRAQLGLARLDRAGRHDDWRRPIHAAELSSAL